MNWIEGIIVYILVWWVVIFMVLPFGVRPPAELVPGQVSSAPARPRLWLKAGVTTLVSLAIWVVIWLIVRSDLFSFRGS